MHTNIREISAGIYRLSTFVPEVAPPAGFTFNQFLIVAEEPMLFHCGHRMMFTTIKAAVERVIPVEKLRWISFSHVEADESGAMNSWLAAAPNSQVAHGMTACAVSLNDLADRAPRALADQEVIDLGGKRIRFLETPHVPHGWDAGLIYEEVSGTLFCSDLLSHTGNGPAMTDGDILTPAIETEKIFQSMSVGPNTGASLRKLAGLAPKTLALMHGSSFAGDGSTVLNGFADFCDDRARFSPN